MGSLSLFTISILFMFAFSEIFSRSRRRRGTKEEMNMQSYNLLPKAQPTNSAPLQDLNFQVKAKMTKREATVDNLKLGTDSGVLNNHAVSSSTKYRGADSNSTSDPENNSTSVRGADINSTCDPENNSTSDPGAENNSISDPGAENNSTSDPGAENNSTSDLGAENNFTTDPGAENNVTSDPGAENNSISDPGAENNSISDPGAENNVTSDPGAEHNSTSDLGAENNFSTDAGANTSTSDPGAENNFISDPGTGNNSTSDPRAENNASISLQSGLPKTLKQLIASSAPTFASVTVNPNPSTESQTIIPATTSPTGDVVQCDEVEPMSCRGKCGEFIFLPCTCDSSCLIYKNCCPDYHEVCTEDVKMGRDKLSPLIGHDVSCIAAYVKGLFVELQVISDCMEDAPEEMIQLCYTSLIKPVTLLHTALHFINSYCLRCNGFHDDHGQQWDFMLTLDEFSYEVGLNPSVLEEEIKRNTTNIFPKPVSTDLVVYCINTAKGGNCPSDTQAKCIDSDTMFLERGEDIFENQYCASCSQLPYHHIKCVLIHKPFSRRGKHGGELSFILRLTANRKVTIENTRFRIPRIWSQAECSINDEVSSSHLLTDCFAINCLTTQSIVNSDVTSRVSNRQLGEDLSSAAKSAARLISIPVEEFHTIWQESDNDRYFISQSIYKGIYDIAARLHNYTDAIADNIKPFLLTNGFRGNITFCSTFYLSRCDVTTPDRFDLCYEKTIISIIAPPPPNNYKFLLQGSWNLCLTFYIICYSIILQ